MKTLYLESIAGIAGDMFTASFVDAGLVSPNALQKLCEQLGIPEVEIIVSKTIRSHMRASHIDVRFDKLNPEQFPAMHNDEAHHHEENHAAHMPFRELDQFILESKLEENTKSLARKILNTLAEAEAHCHGVMKNEVVFHELGMVDSVMDIVMASHCISTLNPSSIIASPIKLGRGSIQTSHGLLPVPPPVSAALAVGMHTGSIPPVITQENLELSTPTGLAILKTLQPTFSKEWPEAEILAQGYGAGTYDLEVYPNLFRVCLLEARNELYQGYKLPYIQEQIIEITANFDDASPEYLAWAAEQLFEQGAVDVWQTTAVGKKGRVMIVMSILVRTTHWKKCVDFILKKTSTFGLRYRPLDRLILDRRIENRTNDAGTFRVKVGRDTQGNVLKEKFEFEDMRKSWGRE